MRRAAKIAVSVALMLFVSASAQSSQRREKVDLNSATLDVLKTLPGVSAAYAQRIVDGRPYTSKTQLVSKGIVPEGVYRKFQAQVIAQRQGKGKKK